MGKTGLTPTQHLSQTGHPHAGGENFAAAVGLYTAGTLTLIAEAATMGLLNFEATAAELRQRPNFRVTDSVAAQILESLEER